MGSSSGDVRFPLAAHHLARVRISSHRFDDWKATAQRDVASVLANPTSWYHRPNDLKAAYRPVYEQDAIRGFARQLDASRKTDVLSLAHLALTLTDIVHGLHATTTTDQRAVSAQLLRDSFLDAAVLRVQEGHTATDPFHFVGLKWIAYRSPAEAILGHRDYVFFESSGTTLDPNGRKVLFVYQRSFPLQGDELHEPDNGCTRGAYDQLALYRMEGGGVLYQAVGQLDPAAHVPTWVTTRYMTEYFDGIKHLVGLASARAIVAAGLWLKHAAPPKGSTEHKACVVCRKKFNMMRSRQNCRACGQSMCKHCVTTLTFVNEDAPSSSAPATRNENFCLTCIQHARDRRAMDNISATLTKTNIAKATGVKSDTISASVSSYAPTMVSMSVSSPYDATSLRNHQSNREDLRHSIERQVGIQHSDSGSSASGSTRSMPMMHGNHSGDDGFHSPGTSHASSTTRTPMDQSSLMFEQMNESIRQQEELLLVIQKEQAKLHARQQAPPPPAYYTTTPAAAAAVPPAPLMPVVYHAAPISPPSHVDDDQERFQVLK